MLVQADVCNVPNDAEKDTAETRPIFRLSVYGEFVLSILCLVKSVEAMI